MKKVLSFVLSLVICVSVVACGETAKENPLAKECANIDEVVNLLVENYEVSLENNEAIKHNPSIYKYFCRDSSDDEIWKKLRAVTDEEGFPVLSLSEINSMYNACNQLGDIEAEEGEVVPWGDMFDSWFEYINIEGAPLIMYGSQKLTVEKLVNSIKNKFKDPDSVSIDNAWICFELPEGAADTDSFNVYDEDCRYVILAEVRVKNGFGAKDISVCRIEGNVGWTFSVKETSSNASLLLRPSAISGHSEWFRLF